MKRDEGPGSRGGKGGDQRRALLARVDAALDGGDIDGAVEAGLRAARLLPGDAELQHACGAALRAAGRPDEALEAFGRARELDPMLPDPWLDGAEVLLEDLGDGLAALDLVRAAGAYLQHSPVAADLCVLRGAALAEMGDLTGSLRAFDDALTLVPGHAGALTERGWSRLELLQLEEAEADLTAAVAAGTSDPRPHLHLGFLLDYTGRRDEATAHFRAAAGLDDELPAEPPRLDEAAFDAAVAEALAGVPPPFAAHLKDVEVGVENYADPEFCRVHDCSPSVLGLYVGTPITELEGSGAPGRLPDRIVLFQRAIENACLDREHVVEEIGVTLRHEIGHHLGFSEDDLADAGHE